MPMMTTRRASVKEWEAKLKATLQELKTCKNLNEQLLQERDDSEIEVQRIVLRNTELKSELADLHKKFLDSLQQNEGLQNIVISFKECSDTHEQALSRIKDLEIELTKAQDTILNLRTSRSSHNTTKVLSLYDELVGSALEPKCQEQIVTIDLTCDKSYVNSAPHFKSHKSVKKYIKIKKIINRCKKQVRQQKYFTKNVTLIQGKLTLEEKLQNCVEELEITRKLYDDDTMRLRSELLCKERSLQEIFSNYVIAQKHLSESYTTAIELVDLVTSNVQSVKVPKCPQNVCCPSPVYLQSDISSAHTSTQHIATSTTEATHSGERCIISSQHPNKVLVFSDRIGVGFGSLLSNCLNCTVENCCMPGASYAQIEKLILNSTIDSRTIVVVYLGDSLGINKKEIITRITNLLKLNACKIMVCAFPYSDLLTNDQNKHIHSLNVLLHNLTCRHSDKLLFFDCNKFMFNFKLTQDSMYCPKKCRHLIATLVAYNIELVIKNITKNVDLNYTRVSTCTNNNVVINCLNF